VATGRLPELLHVPMLPDLGRAERIGGLELPTESDFRQLLINLGEDRAVRAVVFGLLAEMERK
jgi:hypothetical protein